MGKFRPNHVAHPIFLWRIEHQQKTSFQAEKATIRHSKTPSGSGLLPSWTCIGETSSVKNFDFRCAPLAAGVGGSRIDILMMASGLLAQAPVMSSHIRRDEQGQAFDLLGFPEDEQMQAIDNSASCCLGDFWALAASSLASFHFHGAATQHGIARGIPSHVRRT